MDSKQKRALPTVGSRNVGLAERITSRIVQNYLIIWLDQSIDERNPDHKQMITKFRDVANTIKTFKNRDECLDFISRIKSEKIFLIASGRMGREIVPQIQNIAQVNTIYIFCGDKPKHENWAEEYSKIKGIFTASDLLYKALGKAVWECDRDSISMSIMLTSDDAINKSLDQFDQSFVYGQILKEILSTINFGKDHLKEFISYCQEQFADNNMELEKITRFAEDYREEKALVWYTSSSFLSSMLNRALNTFEIDLIMKLAFFIRDLYKSIAELYTEQYAARKYSHSFKVYRGQGLSQTQWDNLKKAPSGLISFNNFLSASKDPKLPYDFACQAIDNSDAMGVLFVMEVHSSKPTVPFADIRSSTSDKIDEEILFSMNSIFRIGHIKNLKKNDRLWEVNLLLVDDNDLQVHALTEHIQEETYPHIKGWDRLGDSLIKLNQLPIGQQLFETMVNQASASEQATIYQKLGAIKNKQKKYEEAITCYKTAVEINETMQPLIYPSLSHSYNCLGKAYEKADKRSEALLFYEKALQTQQQILPPNHPDLAASYRNIATMYRHKKEYRQALSFYDKALEIYQKTLSSHHPDLGIAYYNAARMYDKTNAYTKAVSLFEQAVNIGEHSLPINDPQLQRWKDYLNEAKKKV